MKTLPVPPSLALALTEIPRAGIESMRTLVGINRLIGEHRGSGDGHPVLVLPGYGAADGSTAVLRHFLERIGYSAKPLALGRNVETPENRIQSIDDATHFRQGMAELVTDRVRDIHQETGQALSLVGWSMGGLYAVDASNAAPAMVRQVITLGSPFGDPRGTSLFSLMRRLSRSAVPLETQNFQGWLEKATVADVPTKVIYSKRDGIVGESIATLPSSSSAQHHEIDSSHVGFSINIDVLSEVANTLATR